MTKRKIIQTMLLVVGLIVLSFQTLWVIAEDSSLFTVSDEFQVGDESFAVNMTAPLKWKDTLAVNITFDIVSDTLNGNETITIITLSIYYSSPELPTRKFLEILTPDRNLTETQDSLSLNATVYAPVDISQFNMTVEIIAKSSTVTENQVYTIDFPGIEDMYIEVEKSAALPIINLPGFPNTETFGRWIVIFLLSFVGMGLPAIFVGTVKVTDYIKNRKKVKK